MQKQFWRKWPSLALELVSIKCFIQQNVSFKMSQYLSRGVLPDNLRRGPYAVVDERCDETTLLLRTPDLQQQ